MGKVQVIYDDLRGSQTSLGSGSDALEKISKDIDSLSSSLESAGAGHDNCFGDISTLLDQFNTTIVSDWIEELNSIIAGLAAVVAVFTDEEGNIIDDISKVNGDDLELAIEGCTGQDIPDDETFDLSVYQNREDYDNGTEYQGRKSDDDDDKDDDDDNKTGTTSGPSGTTTGPSGTSWPSGAVTGAVTGITAGASGTTDTDKDKDKDDDKKDDDEVDKDEEENVDDIEEDGKVGPDDDNLNVDTDGDGKPDLNIDSDGDGKADLNIDTDGDGKADLNIDSNGDGKADLNIDTDGDGKADLNIDTDGDGKADKNIDADGDGKVDTEPKDDEEREIKDDNKIEDVARKEPTVILKQILADKPAATVGTASAGVVSGGVSGNVAPTEPTEAKTTDPEPKPTEPEPTEPTEPEPTEPIEPEPTPEPDPGTHQTIPIDTNQNKKSGGTSLVPIIAGIAAAGAAGIGTKIYLDRKSNNNNDEDDQGEEDYSYSGDYDIADNSQSYLDTSDDIGYSAIKDADAALEETVEPLEDAEEPDDSYKAVSFDDLSETH